MQAALAVPISLAAPIGESGLTISRTIRAGILAVALAGSMAAAAPANMDLPATIDITKVTCSDLIAASPLDRAATVMFYWGYAAAKAGVTTFKSSLIKGATEKLMYYCNANRSKTIFQSMHVLGVKAL
jgi:hypothetical protein